MVSEVLVGYPPLSLHEHVIDVGTSKPPRRLPAVDEVFSEDLGVQYLFNRLPRPVLAFPR
jgi:hypothetical protein